jgi:DNA polymerase-3 subunit beta
MKLKIKKEILLENINNVSKAISSKNIIPVLSGIKFDLTKEGLFLTSSDDDITIQSFISKKEIEDIDEVGSIVIPGRYFIEMIERYLMI